MVITEYYNEFSHDGNRKYPKTNVILNEEVTKQMAMHLFERTANDGLKMRFEFEDEFGNDSRMEIIIDGAEIKAISELIKNQLI
jgi:hypothetical protein